MHTPALSTAVLQQLNTVVLPVSPQHTIHPFGDRLPLTGASQASSHRKKVASLTLFSHLERVSRRRNWHTALTQTFMEFLG
jgi:hypothetical protein